MVVQFLSSKSEKYQHLLMMLVFFIFILYSCYTSFGLSLLLVIPLFFFCILGVIYLMRIQIKSRSLVQLQFYLKANKRKVLKRNNNWVLVPSIIYTLLTLLHFYIVYSSGKSLLPLVYDYGIGGVLALGFNMFITNNWHYGICNDGIVIGYKYDTKLIKWVFIKNITYNKQDLIVKMVENFPITHFTLKLDSKTKEFEKLLKYKVL